MAQQEIKYDNGGLKKGVERVWVCSAEIPPGSGSAHCTGRIPSPKHRKWEAEESHLLLSIKQRLHLSSSDDCKSV